MTGTAAGSATDASAGSCGCEPGCRDACCQPPSTHDAGWHSAARRARLLSWISLGYMAAEGSVAIVAAVLASSVALLGFGLDSVIEGLASVIIVWRFTGTRTLSDTAEACAQRGVAITFFLLAPYIAYDAITALATGERPSTSPLGIALAVSSLIVMPMLGRAKHQVGRVLDSAATTGEGTQNLLCAYLAAAVLVGLLANTWFGLWWVDPLVGLLVAGLAVREGMEAWRGEECGC